MKFGDNLKNLRKRKNISQETLADKVGVSRQSVSKWETGEAYPTMTNILVLCTLFHCKINDLVNDSIVDIDSLDEEIKMNVVKFEKDKQKKMKCLSKAIYILARISKIFTMIGGGALVLVMLVIPFFVKEIKVDNNTIEMFNLKASYEEVDNEIRFKPITKDDKLSEYTLRDENQVKRTSEFLNVFRSDNKVLIISFIEISILFIIASIIIVYLILNHLEKLFVNIHNGDTPFSMENVNHLKKMPILMIINIILPNVSMIFINMIGDNNIKTGFSMMNIIYILFLFSMSYIFEYGYQIQQDSKGKMYDEKNN